MLSDAAEMIANEINHHPRSKDVKQIDPTWILLLAELLKLLVPFLFERCNLNAEDIVAYCDQCSQPPRIGEGFDVKLRRRWLTRFVIKHFGKDIYDRIGPNVTEESICKIGKIKSPNDIQHLYESICCGEQL